MTAQSPDKYFYNDEWYFEDAHQGSGLFDPRAYGFDPSSRGTVCYRGFICEYEITDSQLFLKNLLITTGSDSYPDLNGVSVSIKGYEEVGIIFKRRKPIYDTSIRDFNMKKYKDVKLPLSYTGKLIIGKNFLREYYVHAPIQRPFTYETLLELTFENGKLIETVDFSEDARIIREQVDLKDPEWREQLKKLSIDYEKYWWVR